MRHRSGWSGSRRSYLDVFPHAAGQHSHQYRYCGMSHFLASFCLPLLLSVLRVEVAVVFFKKKKMSWLLQRSLSGYISWGDGHCVRRSLPAISPASASWLALCRRALQWQPGILWWMKSDRTKPCFCGCSSQTLLTACARRGLVRRDLWWRRAESARRGSLVEFSCDSLKGGSRENNTWPL